MGWRQKCQKWPSLNLGKSNQNYPTSFAHNLGELTL